MRTRGDRLRTSWDSAKLSPIMYDYQPINLHLLESKRVKHISDLNASTILGVSEGVVRRARVNGLKEKQADLFAIRLGMHPVDFWPEQWLIEGLFAADVKEKRCRPEDVADLVRCGAWL